MTYYPPSQCPHCGGTITTRLAVVSDGKVTSWRTGEMIFPNYTDDKNYECYDAAWCIGCQTQFFVEGR